MADERHLTRHPDHIGTTLIRRTHIASTGASREGGQVEKWKSGKVGVARFYVQPAAPLNPCDEYNFSGRPPTRTLRDRLGDQ